MIIIKNLILGLFNKYYTSYGIRLLYDQFIESMSNRYNENNSKSEIFPSDENKVGIVEKTVNIP